MEYCCRVWAGASKLLLGIVEKATKTDMQECWSFTCASLEPLAHHQNVASLSLFYRYYYCRSSSELALLVPLPYSQGGSTRYCDRLHDFSTTIPTCYIQQLSTEFSAYRMLSFDLCSKMALL